MLFRGFFYGTKQAAFSAVNIPAASTAPGLFSSPHDTWQTGRSAHGW